MMHANDNSAQHSTSEEATAGIYSLEAFDVDTQAMFIWAQHAAILEQFESQLELKAAVYELGRFCLGLLRGDHTNDNMLVNGTAVQNDSPVISAVLPPTVPLNSSVLKTIKERVRNKVCLPIMSRAVR